MCIWYKNTEYIAQNKKQFRNVILYIVTIAAAVVVVVVVVVVIVKT